MIRALGGNRPVGPACEFDYRAGRHGTQYDAVLAGRRNSATRGERSFANPLNFGPD